MKKVYKPKCDGQCGRDNECRGEVKYVSVSGNGFSESKPFYFWYCDTAIKVDQRNGFTVTVQ